MAPQVIVLAAKADDLGSVVRVNEIKGEIRFLQVVL